MGRSSENRKIVFWLLSKSNPISKQINYFLADKKINRKLSEKA